jgi:predicted phage-related endonuclease
VRSFSVIDAPQRSPEWFSARAGKVTASRAADFLARTKSGYSTSRKNYLIQLVAERLTGQPQEDGYVSPAMQRGIELEPQAFAAYESLTGNMPDRVGFLAHNELPIGSSPDGVIGDYEGILELKVPNPATHIGYLKAKSLPADYLPQVTHHLLVSGAAYVDFMSYGPTFPDPLQTFLVRVYRKDVNIAQYEIDLLAFLADVEAELLALQTITNPIAQFQAVLA